jgi:hypothetical protein
MENRVDRPATGSREAMIRMEPGRPNDRFMILSVGESCTWRREKKAGCPFGAARHGREESGYLASFDYQLILYGEHAGY